MRVHSYKILIITLLLVLVFYLLYSDRFFNFNPSIFEILVWITIIGRGFYRSLTESGFSDYESNKDIYDIALFRKYGKYGKPIVIMQYVLVVFGVITANIYNWFGLIILILSGVYIFFVRISLQKTLTKVKRTYFK